MPGFERTSRLEATEYGSWQEVAAWGAALYPARPLHPAITEQAASLARESTNAEEVALRILRFVQDEVRYLAISNEGHALRPHPPEQVLAQRFGDCKDKVYLLQHLLRARGIDSWPMLVHSDERGRVVSHRPSPFAFDHVILRIAIAERKYHVDATHAQQGGTLATQFEPDFAAGLLLSPTATDLESIPARALGEPEQQSDARLKVAADGSAALEIATTFRGSEADDKRSEISGSSLQMLSEQYANYYGKQFPDLQVLEPLQVEDQRLQNRVLTRERYRVGAFWRNGERYLPAEAGEGFLSLPRVVRRVSPLALRHQVWLESRFTIALPFVSTMPSETEVIEDGFFKFSREIRNTGAEVVATFAYRSLADEVPAERVPEHVTALQRAQDHDGINVYEEDQPQGRATPRSDGADLLVVIGTLGGLMALLFAWPTARALAKAFRRRKFRRARLGDLGETPARAAPAGTFQSAEAALAKLRCACGQALDAVAVEWSSLRFQDATLHAARLQCSSCGDAQRRYFSIARAEPSPEPDKT